jgi:hypothetical protein
MIGPVEVPGTHHIGDVLPGDRVHQQTAEQCLLGLYRMRGSTDVLDGAGFATRCGGTRHCNLA